MGPKKVKRVAQRPKLRSPEYPAISLERAVRFVKAIYNEENKSEAATRVILRHMGYSEGSGAGFTTLAAMRKFGLLDGRHGKYRLTEKALDIAIASSGSDEWIAAIRQAALAPAIYRDIWNRYDGVLPSDANLRYYLERERGFTGTAIRRLIPQLRASLQFAGVQPGDQIPDSTAEVVDDDAARPPVGAVDTSVAFRRGDRARPSDLPLPVVLENGNILVVRIPKMTAAAFDFFKQQLETYREAIVQNE